VHLPTCLSESKVFLWARPQIGLLLLGSHRLSNQQLHIGRFSASVALMPHEGSSDSVVRHGLTAESWIASMMKNAVFWVGTPCGSCKNRRFGGTYRLHHQ
jgi:hypothetical protein